MSKIKGNAARVYSLFLSHRRLTDVQLQEMLKDINPNSIRPSRLRLEKLGLIRRTKHKIKHKVGKKNNYNTVYELAFAVEQKKNDIQPVVDKIASIREMVADLSKIFDSMTSSIQEIVKSSKA